MYEIYFYLNLQTEAEAKGEHDIMNCQDVKRAVAGTMADFVPPLHANWLVLWGEEKDHDSMEVEFGDQVRLKTRGDSPLIGTNLVLQFCCFISYHTAGKFKNQTF